MKHVVNLSLGSSSDDYEFIATFLGKEIKITRIGTDGDYKKLADAMLRWNKKADVIGLGHVKFPYKVGKKMVVDSQTDKLNKLGEQMQTPVTTGENLRKVTQEWSLRHIQFKFGNNYFNNNRVLFVSGMANYTIANVISEFTDNLSFADPLYEHGIPKFLKSVKDLERYASGAHSILKWVPGKTLASSSVPMRNWNDFILKKGIQKAHVIVVPAYDFYYYLENCTAEDLAGKTVITATAYDDRIEFLKERGVDVIIDTTPKIVEQMVGIYVLEAMMLAVLDKPQAEVTNDDFLEIISDQRMDPRVIYPSGTEKRTNRFAFVIHPLSQEFLKKDKSIDLIAKIAPSPMASPVMDAVEKAIAYAPPMIYSKVTGIKSPLGVETEGWLITIGGTPKQILSHPPEFTYNRLLQAAKMAKRLGAQIMGLGAFTKVVGDAGVTVAKLADLPITTGNSYSASGALWAAADAVRRMGLIDPPPEGERIKGKTMVIGATGAIGSVCCRLLAKAFDEVYMVDVRDAKLLALQDSIQTETPGVKTQISTRADKYLPEMDVIVTATSAGGKTILDIERVKPGCVITDVARPLDLSPEDVAKRPDVLYIESGEILLPGDPQMRSIGLPPKVAYACLAETIVLALEGRYEVFTIGRNIEWEKVREIYKMGLKHGMRLAAISGVNGVYSDEDILKIRELAIEKRKTWKPETV